MIKQLSESKSHFIKYKAGHKLVLIYVPESPILVIWE
jgi:hypothetical protein